MVQLETEFRLLLCRTELGWLAVLSDGRAIHELKFGYRQRAELLRDTAAWRAPLGQPNVAEARWLKKLTNYAAGERVSLADLPIHEPPGTEFQRRVRQLCRQIPSGQVRTYGELAADADSPQAARAVGNVMRTNRLPLVIPCHRVVGANGLGGFSAPDGLDMKRRLLQLESRG